jgi:hypothetical protein
LRRWLRRFIRFCLICFSLLLLLIAIEAIAGWRCPLESQIPAPLPQPEERKTVTVDIKDYSRPEIDTYLSLPEWYIVWSYQEKADFQKENLPGEFPFFAAVRQYWNIFCCVGRLTKGNYLSNNSEQFAQVVIGTSYSGEYILKGLYEETIGKLSEWTSGHQFTEEDRYAAKVASDYADFVHIRPFYEFHFARHITGLWTQTPFFGAHFLRKVERKAFLTLDYSIEAFYCWLMEKATHLSYGYEPDQTYVWVDNVDESGLQQIPRLKEIKTVGPRAYIVSVPRYQEFTPIASDMAQRGIHFVEIAGNSSITISMLAPRTWKNGGSNAQRLFTLPIVIRPDWQRIVFRCDVGALDQFLNSVRTDNVVLEHIYDY